MLLKRDTADEAFVRGVWLLLPDRTRADLWPASFAFSGELGFHLAVGPNFPPPATGGVKPLTEETVKDYPSSSYELSLQIAIESGDRAALARLLARRTADDIIRLAVYILVFALVVAAVFRFVL